MQRLRDEPRPLDPKPYGCLTFLVAGALLLLLPQLPKWFGWTLPQPFGQILFVVLVITLAGGVFVGIFVVTVFTDAPIAARLNHWNGWRVIRV